MRQRRKTELTECFISVGLRPLDAAIPRQYGPGGGQRTIRTFDDTRNTDLQKYVNNCRVLKRQYVHI